MNFLPPLAYQDLAWCLRRAPGKLLEQLIAHPGKLFVAGGFVRSCITNEPINDLDVFCGSKEFARSVCLALVDQDLTRIHESENAFTLRGFSFPIQFIHRWTFDMPEQCVESFDFTIARAAFWRGPVSGVWESACAPSFYADLAGRRLVYCNPVRNEEAGGSLLRVLKFYQRGYRIPLDSLGDVIARLMRGVSVSTVLTPGQKERIPRSLGLELTIDEQQIAKVFTGLLREVDPSIDPSHVAHLPSDREVKDDAVRAA